MVETKTRKELPNFGYIANVKFPIEEILKLCESLDLLNFDNYNDIKVSSNSKQSLFVRVNAFNKNSFFKEEEAAELEGEKYRQIYLTELDPKYLDQPLDLSSNNSRMARQRRLDPGSENYNPVADELNYNTRNKLVTGLFETILDSFSDKITRVRLAYLSPNFSIKPHVDYDPSYITRLHLPIITNPNCHMHVFRNNVEYRAHYPADGRLYFLNAGLKHFASNNSNEGRLHLIIDMHGQNSLKDLVELECVEVSKG